MAEKRKETYHFHNKREEEFFFMIVKENQIIIFSFFIWLKMTVRKDNYKRCCIWASLDFIKVWVVFTSFDLVFIPRSNLSEYSVIWSIYGTSSKFLHWGWFEGLHYVRFIIYQRFFHRDLPQTKMFPTVKFTVAKKVYHNVVYFITVFFTEKFWQPHLPVLYCKFYR